MVSETGRDIAMFTKKIKAFGFHLLISLIIATVSLAIVLLVWYPQPLFQATGVGKIFLLMLGIDVVLGPLLTFIVYKPNKKSLKLDLTVIICVQLAAFIYGFYHVYDGRPVWIAYNVDRFDLVRNNEIDNRKLLEAEAIYQNSSNIGPRYVAAVIPRDDLKAFNQILFDEIQAGIAPSQRPELYRPLKSVNDKMENRAKELDELYKYNDKNKVKKILSLYTEADSFLPLKASADNMVVLLNKENSIKIIKIVDLRPW